MTEATSIRHRGARAAADQNRAADDPIVVPPAYPSWRYHRTEPACIVPSQAESDALGSDWSDAPFSDVAAAVPEVVLSPERLAEIKAEAEAKAQAEQDAKDKPARDAAAKRQADADAAIARKADEKANAEADKAAEVAAKVKADAERAAAKVAEDTATADAKAAKAAKKGK